MLHQLTDRIWYMEADRTSDRPVLGYIRGDRKAFAVDAGASKAHVDRFYDALRAQNLALPEFTGITHSHWDHSYGAAFVQGVTLSSRRCAEHLAAEAKWVWTRAAMDERLAQGEDIAFGYWSKLAEYPDPADITVVPPALALDGNAIFDLGGIHVEAIHCGGSHSDDGLVFLVPEERFLFLGDASGKALFDLDWDFDPKHPEKLGEILAALPYDMARLRPFVELLESLPFDRCFHAHESAPWMKEWLIEELKRSL